MTLIPGMLVSFDDPLLNVIPNVIVFQYNPNTITRVLTPPTTRDTSTLESPGRAQAVNANEAYSLTLEFDATDGLEREGPITTRLGIAPRLAALELLMQPNAQPALAQVAQKVVGKGAAIPPTRVPLTILIWGPARVAPVTLETLSITETGFDELLNPIHAHADVGFRVVRSDEVKGDKLGRAAATYYQGARRALALASIAQLVELMTPAEIAAQIPTPQVGL
jgi:hypothetical protein